MKWLQRASLMLAMLAVMPLSWALSEDARQPIRIEADAMHLDEKRGEAVYTGNVRMRQGSIRLQADRVVVISAGKGISQVRAYGAPARFRQQLNGERGEVVAHAANMEYQTVRDWLVLDGDAYLKQSGNEFSGKRLEYDLRQETLSARRGEQDGERVRITIEPDSRRD